MLPRLLLDTNVSLLFVVGAVDPGLISKITRTKGFDQPDYEILLSMIPQSASLVTTPHILTEVSNLMVQGVHGERRTALREKLRNHCQVLDERFVHSKGATIHPAFSRLGLTDVAVSLLAKSEQVQVITADFDLWRLLTESGVDAVNFNHHRRLVED